MSDKDEEQSKVEADETDPLEALRDLRRMPKDIHHDTFSHPRLLQEVVTSKQPAWLGVDSALNASGRSPIGGDGLCPPGEQITITRVPQAFFRGNRLFVHSLSASHFIIHSVYAGCLLSGVPARDPVMTEPFAVDFDDLAKVRLEELKDQGVLVRVERGAGDDALGLPWNLPTLRPGEWLTVNVECIDSRPRRFIAAWSGSMLVTRG